MSATPGARPFIAEWGALVAVSLATLMMLVDFAAVCVALPAIHAHMSISFSELEWALEAFVLTLATFVLTAGYIADRVGRRAAFMVGLEVLAIGGVVAGLAGRPAELLAGRVVQGIGGALIFATGSPLLVGTFRRHGDRLALGAWGTITGLGVAVSPVVGGAVAGAIGWRWLFLLNVPVCLVALLFGWGAAFHQPAREQKGAKPDWRALGLWTGALALLVIGLVRTTASANLSANWSSNGIVALFCCSALLMVAFVSVESVSPSPLLDISLFRHRTFTGSTIAALGLSMAVWGPLLFIVLYMSYDLKYSVLAIGLRLLLLTGMTVPFLPVAGLLDRWVPVKVLICGGLALVAGGLYWMSRLTTSNGFSGLWPGLVMAGIGLELVNPRLAAAAAATVRPSLAAVASRASSTFRLVGTAAGVAVLGSVFATRLKDDIANAFTAVPQLAGYAPRVTELVLGGQSRGAVLAVPRLVRVDVPPIVAQGFVSAMHSVLLGAAGVALASAVLALSLRSADVPRALAEVPAPDVASRRAAEAAAAGLRPTTPEPAHMPAPSFPPTTVVAPDEIGAHEAPAFYEAAGADQGAPVDEEAAESTPADEEDRTLAELLTSFLAAVQSSEPPLAQETVGRHQEPGPAWEDAEPEPQPWPAWEDAEPEPEPVPAAREDEEATPAAQAEQEPQDGAGPAPEQMVSPAPAPTRATNGRSVIDLARSERWLRGHVMAMTGEALAGAVVTLVGPDGGEAGHAVTAGDGSFAVGDVSEGTYTVVAAAVHYRPTAAIVALRSGETNTSFALLGIGSLAGRVTRAMDGEPLGAEVELMSPSGGIAARCRTDERGGFVVSDLIEGPYQLTIESAGYRPESLRVVVKRGRPLAQDVALTGLGNLYGAVCGPEGGWVAHVDVALSDSSGRVVAVTTTDGAGSYHFPGVAEGTYSLSTPSGSTRAVAVSPGSTVAADLTVGQAQ